MRRTGFSSRRRVGSSLTATDRRTPGERSYTGASRRTGQGNPLIPQHFSISARLPPAMEAHRQVTVELQLGDRAILQVTGFEDSDEALGGHPVQHLAQDPAALHGRGRRRVRGDYRLADI